MTTAEKGERIGSLAGDSRLLKKWLADRTRTQQGVSQALAAALRRQVGGHTFPPGPRPQTPVISSVTPSVLHFEDAVLNLSGRGFGQDGSVLTAWLSFPEGPGGKTLTAVELPITSRSDSALTLHPIPGSWQCGPGQSANTVLWVVRDGVQSNLQPITLESTAPAITDVFNQSLPGTPHDVRAGNTLLITGLRFLGTDEDPVTVTFMIACPQGTYVSAAIGVTVTPADLTQITVQVPRDISGVTASDCLVQVTSATGTSEWWGAGQLHYHPTLHTVPFDFASTPFGAFVSFEQVPGANNSWDLRAVPGDPPGTCRDLWVVHELQYDPDADIFQEGTDTFMAGRSGAVGDAGLALVNGWTVADVVCTPIVSAAQTPTLETCPRPGDTNLRTAVRWRALGQDVPTYEVCGYLLSVDIKGPVGVPYLDPDYLLAREIN